jgi:5-methylcytosine-specific restriction endonuclease McrA
MAVKYRKKAIPNAVRRGVALKYGCPPGGRLIVSCHYCGAADEIFWHRNFDGSPSGWVSFGHELDHVYPEFLGGLATVDNIVLACRSCNRRKGHRA